MFFQYPYTDMYALNLDWMIKAIKEVQEIIENLGHVVNTVNGQDGDVTISADMVNATGINSVATLGAGVVFENLTQEQLQALYNNGVRLVMSRNNLGVFDRAFFLTGSYEGSVTAFAYDPTGELSGVVSVNGLSGALMLNGANLPISEEDTTTIKALIDHLDEYKLDSVFLAGNTLYKSYDSGTALQIISIDTEATADSENLIYSGAVVDAVAASKAVIDAKLNPDNATPGTFLQINSEGESVWGPAATDAQVADAVTDWLDENVPTGTTVVVDRSLTVQDAAADAKVTGDEIADLKSAFGEISQPSRNLWPFDSSVTFTRYMYYKPGGVVLPAGKYIASAAITSGSGVTSARIRFDNNDGTEITYKKISTDGQRHDSPTITLTEDCYAIWLFSANDSSASTGVDATWSDIQIESGKVSTSYVPHLSARDTVAEKTIADLRDYVNKKIYGNGHLLPDSVGIESFDFVEVGTNLFNFNDTKNVLGYITDNGKITPNESYKTSWFIKVSPSTVYYVGGQNINSSYKNAKFICEFDEDLNVVLWSENVSDHFTTQSTTKYIRFTYSSSLLATKCYFGATDWDGNTAPAYTAVIPSEYVEGGGGGGGEISLPNQYSVSGNLPAGGYLKNEDMANSICRNERVMFNSDITSFSSLEIGFAWFSTNYKYNRLVIDGTNLTVYDYNGNTDVSAHGLTIENNIQVLVESNFMRKCNITIISNGQLFKAEGKELDRRRIDFLYAQSIGSTLPNAKLSWTCVDFDKPVWIFGDSYVASYTNKWVKYLYQYGYDKNVLFDAFPGEDSSESIVSLQHLLTIAKPKKIVWCLGMNDGSDENSDPSTKWATAQASLRALCEEKGITLILATIPTVPTINHEYKNANVRASGYRYIDFARAVGASSSGVWYDSMLSQDGVHPSDAGAKALFGRAVLDVPELMITP